MIHLPRSEPGWRNIFGNCLHREHCRHQHGRAHRADFGIHSALFPAVLFPGAARWDGAGLRHRLRLNPCGCVDVSECRQDFVFEIGGRLAGVLNHNSHSPNFFNHAGHPLGLHFARRTLSDRRPATRDSSNDVCTGVGFGRAFVVGACEVFLVGLGFMSLISASNGRQTNRGSIIETERGSRLCRPMCGRSMTFRNRFNVLGCAREFAEDGGIAPSSAPTNGRS